MIACHSALKTLLINLRVNFTSYHAKKCFQSTVILCIHEVEILDNIWKFLMINHNKCLIDCLWSYEIKWNCSCCSNQSKNCPKLKLSVNYTDVLKYISLWDIPFSASLSLLLENHRFKFIEQLGFCWTYTIEFISMQHPPYWHIYGLWFITYQKWKVFSFFFQSWKTKEIKAF